MFGYARSIVMVSGLLLTGMSLALAEESPASPPAEEDVQSRGIVGAPRQIPGTVQFAFQISGAGRLDIAIGSESYSCTSSCTRALRAGTPIQVKAVKSNPLYGFKEWQGCTGRITGATCQMTVPTNKLAAGLSALFTSSTLEDMAAMREQFCRQYPVLCQSCNDPAVRARDPQCLRIPPAPR